MGEYDEREVLAALIPCLPKDSKTRQSRSGRTGPQHAHDRSIHRRRRTSQRKRRSHHRRSLVRSHHGLCRPQSDHRGHGRIPEKLTILATGSNHRRSHSDDDPNHRFQDHSRYSLPAGLTTRQQRAGVQSDEGSRFLRLLCGRGKAVIRSLPLPPTDVHNEHRRARPHSHPFSL